MGEKITIHGEIVERIDAGGGVTNLKIVSGAATFWIPSDKFEQMGLENSIQVEFAPEPPPVLVVTENTLEVKGEEVTEKPKKTRKK